jgi:hypothetical protein
MASAVRRDENRKERLAGGHPFDLGYVVKVAEMVEAQQASAVGTMGSFLDRRH